MAIYTCENCGIVTDDPTENSGIGKQILADMGKSEEIIIPVNLADEIKSEIAPDGPEMGSDEICDKCGVIAYIHVVMPSEFDLWFCGHHYDLFGPEIEKQGGKAEDIREIHD